MQPSLGSGAALADSTDSGRAAFATTRFGQLTARSACSNPGTLTIELDGELDIASAPGLERLLTELESDRWPTVVLDLRRLSFIDSSGIRALLTAHRRIGRLVVRHPSRSVRRTLAVSGADAILDLTDVVDEPTRDPQVRRPQSGAEPADGPMLMEVANAVVTACKTHAGKGPERARAHLRPNALYVVLQDWTTVAERTLLAGGRQDLVSESRCHLHDQVADAARSTVEDATGRTVIASRSHIDFNRNTAIVAFILGRAA